MLAWKRWQDWAVVVLGILLFLAPFAFRDTAMMTAAWTAWIGGALLVIFGLVSLGNPAMRISEWIEGLVAVLVFISPWVLNFTDVNRLAWSAWILGGLAFLSAVSALYMGHTDHPRMAVQH